MKKKRPRGKNYRLEYKHKQPLDAETLAQVLVETAWDIPSDDQAEFIEQAETIIKRLEEEKDQAA